MALQSDKLKIAFLGTPKIAAEVLEKLIPTAYKPQLVITGYDKKQGRGQALVATPVKLAAEKATIVTSYKMSSLDKSFDLAILIAYGRIIPNEILRLPKFGFINIHPSLLPKYRGPSPITSAILAGDKTTGVTLIVLDSELDHGPIIGKQQAKIDKADTHDSLATKLASIGAKLLLETLPDYLNQNITPQPQDHSQAAYTEKITKESGKIDINKPPDVQTLDRMVRAFYPWPTVWFELDRKRIKLLPENKIQPEGKKPMTLQEFQNGYPNYKDLVMSFSRT